MTAVVCLLIAGASVFGAGFQLYTEGSAEALGQAGAISGRTNLTSLAWYNPSGLAGTDRAQIMVGNTFALIDTEFNSALSSALDSEMEDHWRNIPHLYYVQPLSDRLTGTLAINAPYGLITEWPDGWTAGSLAATRTDLSTMYVTPSVAWAVHERFSVSAGMNVVSAEANLRSVKPGSVNGVTGAYGDFTKREIEGDDIGYGYTASVHCDVLDGWAVGGRFQSRVDMTLEGDVTYDGIMKTDTKADLELPATVNLGVANTSINKLSLGLDFVWTEWSTYDEMNPQFDSAVPPLITGTGTPADGTPAGGTNDRVSKRWKNVWSIRVGADYQLTDNLALRCGYVWDESPMNGDTRSPELPDSDRQMVMAGLGCKWKGVGIDLAYSYLWAKKADTGSEVVAKLPSLAGEYETVTHLVSLSAGFAF